MAAGAAYRREVLLLARRARRVRATLAVQLHLRLTVGVRDLREVSDHRVYVLLGTSGEGGALAFASAGGARLKLARLPPSVQHRRQQLRRLRDLVAVIHAQHGNT